MDTKKIFKHIPWVILGIIGAFCLSVVALRRGEHISALWIVVASVSVYLVAYRYYSLYIAQKVMKLDPTRATPAVINNDGLNYVPTNRNVLFGHHFAAIAGAGPLVGPVLAAQMGYLPGTLWRLAGVVLAAMLVGRFTALMIDGWVGLVVACFILFSGYQAAKETLGPLLGQPPEQELVERIRQMVLSHPPICGIHDLVVHDYGPGRMMVSLHAEVPAHGDILELHDVIDTAEMELKRTLHCNAVIHMDPIITDDAQIVQLRRRVAELVRQVDSGMTIHDFRVVPGPSHTNLIFDAVLPFGEHITEAEAARQIRERVRQMDGGEYYAVVTVENPYV